MINSLLRAPERNFYSLVRDPSQTAFDRWQTVPPIDAFTSGFLGYSSAAIQAWLAIAPQFAANNSGNAYAVLDERSASDLSSVVLWYRVPWTDLVPAQERAGRGLGNATWRAWRTTFTGAEQLAISLSMVPVMRPVLCRSDLVREDGIFDYDRALVLLDEGYF